MSVARARPPREEVVQEIARFREEIRQLPRIRRRSLIDIGDRSDDGALFVGIHHAPERVLFVTAGRSRDTVLAALAEWALGQARRKLRGKRVEEVERLIAARLYENAVQTYLRHVAETWDPEWVAVRPLRIGSSERSGPK